MAKAPPADAKESTKATGPKKAAPAPKPAKKVPSKFDPKKSRKSMAAFLRGPAEKAIKRRDWGTAIPIQMALVAALGNGDQVALDLAKTWQAAGQQKEAVEALRRFIAATTDAKAKKLAEVRLNRLKRRRLRFEDQGFRLRSSPKLAKMAFDRGRRQYRAKHYADALIHYRMGYALAPDAAGFLREIGAAYEKLGAKKERTKWYVSYLRRRPFGKIANAVRKSLRKEKGVLGTVTISSPFPCDQFVVAERDAPKPPIKKLKMAPGKYTMLCVNNKYRIGYWEENFEVVAGKKQKLTLAWAVVVNDLKKPYGRIVLENPSEAGVMMDLGISTPEIGVAVPRDRRALKMILKADDGSKSVERYLRLEPGAREVVKW